LAPMIFCSLVIVGVLSKRRGYDTNCQIKS
jgi:hypothetical protein